MTPLLAARCPLLAAFPSICMLESSHRHACNRLPGLQYARLGAVHGGACCLHVAANGELGSPAVLLGVSHSKDLNYQYLQQFYAFRPEPPFDLFAMSRPFCWRGVARTRETFLSHENLTYPCPYIQMTMSISPKHDEPDAVLFAVGMNDCEADLVTMRKRDVLELLFPPPPQARS